MKFTQIRNATAIVDFAGKTFLVDPMLSPKGAFPGFPGTMNSHIANPTVELPLPLSAIIDVDAVIVTHIHPDHWDDTAERELPKTLPLFVQDEKDAQEIRDAGFQDVRVLSEDTEFAGIRLSKTSGAHGRGFVLEHFSELLGEVSGVVFQHPQEKTVYLAGDTVWNDHVAEAMQRYQPEVVILNSGDARIVGYEPIIMTKDDVLSVHRTCPSAVIIATHMEAVNHATLSRDELREFVTAHQFAQQVRIPLDGETITL